jgi:hypothetical protein
MAGKPVGLVETNMILASFSRRLEYRIDDGSHCKDSRPGVDRCTIHIELAHLAAGHRFLFKDGNLHAARREQNRADQAAYACADNDGLAALKDVAAPDRKFRLTAG